jgi:hypothetical protein
MPALFELAALRRLLDYGPMDSSNGTLPASWSALSSLEEM